LNANQLPSNRSFGSLFAVVFALVGGYVWWRGGSAHPWWLGLSGLTLLVTLARPSLLAGLNRAWMKLAELLSKVVSPVVLGLMFYAVLTPVGIAMRLFGRDAMKRKVDPRAPSYWEDRTPPGPDPSSLPYQF
jgi:hypothetical protein